MVKGLILCSLLLNKEATSQQFCLKNPGARIQNPEEKNEKDKCYECYSDSWILNS